MGGHRDIASPEFYLDQALAAFDEARDLVERETQPGTFGVLQHDIAQVHETAGRFDDALEHYRDAAECKRRAGDHADLEVTLRSLADCLRCLAMFTEARDVLDEAAALLRGPGVDLGRGARATRMHEIARQYERLGDHGEDGAYRAALDSYSWALDLINQEVDPRSCATILRDIGRVHRVEGRLADSADAYAAAAGHLRGGADPGPLISALIDLGRAYRRLAESGNDGLPPAADPATGAETASAETDDGTAGEADGTGNTSEAHPDESSGSDPA